ncbi:hypothetical protein JW979_10860 [bacterium]|nr:hypothetical protein [candidate division CSSED10-310 bacterium]
MKKRMLEYLGIFIFVLCFISCNGSNTPGESTGFLGSSLSCPSASLWPDGAWVRYKQIRLDSEGNSSEGTLQVSAVGKEMVDNTPYYWIELREDKKDGGVVITKFLASENTAFNPIESMNFWDDIKRIIIQENTNTPEEIPAPHLKRFTPTFVESVKSRRFGNVNDVVEPEITELPDITVTVGGKELNCPGKRVVRKFTSMVNLGFLHLEDTTESATELYTHPEVPFGGIAKVTHTSTTFTVNKLRPEEEPKAPIRFENSMVLEDFGISGAKSQIIGTPVEKEVLPFPFLKGKTQHS